MAPVGKGYVVQTRDACGVPVDLDLHAEFRRMCRLRAFNEQGRVGLRACPPEFHVRRRRGTTPRDVIYTAGRGSRGRISVTLGREPDTEKVRELLLHELVHAYVHKPDGGWHQMPFKRKFAEAAEEMWPGIRCGSLTDGAYVIDRRVVDQLRTRTMQERAEVAA